MSGLLLSEETQETTLRRISDLTVRCIEHCNAVAVTLFVGGRPATRAATGGLVYEVDHFQYDIGEGPCLQRPRALSRMKLWKGVPAYSPPARVPVMRPDGPLVMPAAGPVLVFGSLFQVMVSGVCTRTPVHRRCRFLCAR